MGYITPEQLGLKSCSVDEVARGGDEISDLPVVYFHRFLAQRCATLVFDVVCVS